ncbi:dTMP kinase [Aquabacterium sp. CECT 9606]|uniref:dTMP kinase n=1 Tax=Aquabacterium sp. CECT 9606 TaxID=2845822 RepID=UPI001E5DFAC2|nr:dTMP kinase [Aquabacterium sp. CECT 9606]CAH0352879.1 Thymidylate kinase [Aquabacterium sp. CECT 9606]
MSRFISFEGIDGAGKTSHLDALESQLRQAGHDVVRTREPGGTPLAEKLRESVLHDAMDALTESLLVFAARRDHLVQVIEPALARGAWVLSDRFTDATFAYQGAGRGFDLSVLSTLEKWVQGQRQPDLTFLFDLPPEVAAARLSAARQPDRFEAQDTAFFERVRAGYQARLRADAQRFALIDASANQAEVARQVDAALQSRGWL